MLILREFAHLAHDGQNAAAGVSGVHTVRCSTRTVLTSVAERRRDVAGHAVRLANLVRPEPRELVAPLTQ